MSKATEMRVRWEWFPNTAIRELHTDYRLFKHWGHDFGAEFNIVHAMQDQYYPLSEHQAQLVADLHAVNGVCAVGVDRYKVSITKAEVFEWEEICQKVEHVLSEWCGLSICHAGDSVNHVKPMTAREEMAFKRAMEDFDDYE